MAEIIAQSGTRFMALVEPGIVRIIDTDEKIVGPRLDEIRALMNGLWEPCDNRPDILDLSRGFKWQKIPAHD